MVLMTQSHAISTDYCQITHRFTVYIFITFVYLPLLKVANGQVVYLIADVERNASLCKSNRQCLRGVMLNISLTTENKMGENTSYIPILVNHCKIRR